MLKRILPLSALAAIAAVSVAFMPPSPPVPQDKEDTQLALYMKDINKSLRGLRSALRDAANNGDSISTIRGLQGLLLKARVEKPAMTKDTPEEERAEFLTEYQKQIVEFHRGLLDLEIFVLDGDNEGAQGQLKALNELKSSSHKLFKVKD